MSIELKRGMLVPAPKGAGSFLSKSFRQLVCNILQCMMNLNIKAIISNSGVGPTTVDAKMTYTPSGATAELDLTSISGSGGAGSDQWPPIELDATIINTAGAWCYISPTDAIATTGMYDIDAGAVVIAMPGLWRPRITIPAQAADQYNVPQDLGIAGKWILIRGGGSCSNLV